MTAYDWGVVTEVVRDGEALSRAIELAYSYLKVPEITRRNTRVHFTQPLKERIVREVGYGTIARGCVGRGHGQVDAGDGEGLISVSEDSTQGGRR